MKKIVGLIICCLLFSCASPSKKFSLQAREMGFTEVLADTNLFSHRMYSNDLASKSPTQPSLHVYLDGDGTPWKNQRWISSDPTSRNHLIINMMAQDKAPAILLGRPCYYGLSQVPNCHYKYWTSHRYSKEVVSSMSYALNNWLKHHAYSQVVLIGYSGGGSLAMLMAPKINADLTVITVAANLDIKAWSQFHNYSSLFGSLNPTDYSLPKAIRQFHLYGGRDDVVPEFIVKKIAKNNNQARFIAYDQFGHHCCWGDEWEKILAKIPVYK